MAWATAKQLEPRVIRVLSDNNYDPDEIDKEIINSSTEDAKNEIIVRLRTRGYTIAQINTWARQREYNLDIGVYYSLIRMTFPREEEEQDWVEMFNRAEELDDVELFTLDGTLIDPGDTPSAAIFELFDLEELNDDLDQVP